MPITSMGMMKLFREAKTFLYLVLFAIFFWQLYEAGTKLQSGQLTTKISYEVKPSFTVPSATVCHYQVYAGEEWGGEVGNRRKGKTLTELKEEADQKPLVTSANFLEDSTVEAIQMSAQWNLKNESMAVSYPQAKYASRGVSFEDLWSSRYSSFFPDHHRLMKCETFNPNREMRPTLTGLFYLNVEWPRAEGKHLIVSKIIVKVHEEGQLSLDLGGKLGNGFLVFDDSSLPVGYQAQILIRQEKQKTQDRPPAQPCHQAGEEVSIDMCMKRYLEKTMRCVLPWEKRDEENEGLRACESSEDASTFIRAIDESFGQDASSSPQLLSVLGCHLNCEWKKYNLEVMFTMNIDNIDGIGMAPNQSRLAFTLYDETLKTVEEIYNYCFSDFVAESGGYLGMLVGISAVTVVEEVERILKLGFIDYIKMRWF